MRMALLTAVAGTIWIAALSGCGTASKSAPAPRALTSTTATSTTQAPRVGCPQSSGAHTLAASRSVRVFQKGGFVYACLNTGKGFRLGRSGHCDPTHREGVSQVALAERVLAFGLETCGVDTGSTDLIVARLGDRTRITQFSPTLGNTGVESHYSVDSLVVTPGGAVAWIGSGSGISGKQIVEVHIARGNRDELIDSSPQIKTNSLRLQGSQLSWRHGGATRSATLE